MKCYRTIVDYSELRSDNPSWISGVVFVVVVVTSSPGRMIVHQMNIALAIEVVRWYQSYVNVFVLVENQFPFHQNFVPRNTVTQSWAL